MPDDDERYPSAPPQGPKWPERGIAHQVGKDRCEGDRSDLTPQETADCAGEKTAELFENEEDGGS